MKETTLAKNETTAVAKVEASDLLQVLSQAATNPDVNVEKMERLWQMHQQMVRYQAEVAFKAAKARVAPLLPEIPRNGQSHHGAYSRLEDIDRLIRPIIAKEGFALAFDSTPVEGGKIKVTCELSHEQGHSETKALEIPLDTSGSKNGAQAVRSTISYGRRTLTEMHFNLVSAWDDTDGNATSEPITEDQVRDLEILITEAKANKAKFLDYMEVESLAQIQRRHLKKAIAALEAKRKAK